MQHARRGDRIIVTELARAGRRPAALLTWLDQLAESGIEFESLSEGIVIVPGETNPLGRLLVHLLAAVAELERPCSSVERQRAVRGIEAGVRFDDPRSSAPPRRKSWHVCIARASPMGMTATAFRS